MLTRELSIRLRRMARRWLLSMLLLLPAATNRNLERALYVVEVVAEGFAARDQRAHELIVREETTIDEHVEESD